MNYSTLLVSLLVTSQALPLAMQSAVAQSVNDTVAAVPPRSRVQTEDWSDAFYMKLDYKVALRQEEQLRGKRPVYTYDEVEEKSQLLPNGNQVKTTKTRSFARDQNGRTRIEYTTLSGARRIAILDLAAQTAYLVRPERNDVLRLSGADLMPPAAPAAATRQPPAETVPDEQPLFNSSEHKKLGTKEMEGLQVTGSTWEFTIAPGRKGNEKEMKEGTEAWHSADLGMNLYFRGSSARFGDRITRVENLKLGQVPASLFDLPDGYPIRDVVLPKSEGSAR